ncbi:MAG: phosphoglycerate dehydrogenase [Gemmatimonadaceae bacterium]|nr:phosphoglycerate dehydrogenase [Gemmatimonadaceae bacterium]
MPASLRILVTDEIDPEGVALLRAEPAFQVDELPTLPAAELLERIGEYDAIVGRSATKVTEALLRRATRLKVVGRAGVGVDNIAMDVATELGIAVINAPAGNTVAVAELFFGAVISLRRHLTRADQSMHEGRWERSQLLGTELRGKTLGIVGLGRIGGEVAVRAHAFGMEVHAYDPYVSDERFAALRVKRAPTLEAVLDVAQFLTVHVPLTDETTAMIDATAMARLRPGAVVVNMARGGIVDDDALRAALDRGHLAGAVLDVYLKEPLTGDHAFRAYDNVVLLPHIGASSAEAQRNVAVDACEAVRDALLIGDLSRSLNGALAGEDAATLGPALLLARRAATVARALLAERGATAIDALTLKTGDDLTASAGALLAAAAAGLLDGVVENERLNLINARSLATARGVVLAHGEGGFAPHSRAIEVRLSAGSQTMRVGGVAALDFTPRLTRIADFHVDVAPRGTLLVLTNHDVPGVIGRVGTALAEAGVNIAEYHQARLAAGGEALAVITIDGAPPAHVRDTLLALRDVRSATVVRFGGPA